MDNEQPQALLRAPAQAQAQPQYQAQPQPQQPEQKPQEQLYTLSFTREEIQERIKILSESENVVLYSKVQKGAEEADELQKLVQLLGQQ